MTGAPPSAHRQRLRALLGSGWTRLFLVLWLPWIGFLGYRYYRLEDIAQTVRSMLLHKTQRMRWEEQEFQRQHQGMSELEPGSGFRYSPVVASYEESVKSFEQRAEQFAGAEVQFFLFGLAAPPAIALAAWWVSQGFRRAPR